MAKHSKKSELNAASLRETSRRMRSATIGTHVQRTTAQTRRSAKKMGLSSGRKQQRAVRGEVHNVRRAPAGRNARAGRATNLEFAASQKSKGGIKRIAVVVVVLLLIAAIVAGVGAFVLINNLNGKLALKNSDATSTLVSATSGQAYYTLVAADLDEEGMPYSNDGYDAFALVRTDASTKKVNVIAIPANTQVSLKDGKYHALREAETMYGDSSLISAVANLTGVEINHFVSVNAQGVMQLVDALGGISVNVAEEVDDPRAGSVYLPAGQQTLSGKAALTYARATNYTDSLNTKSAAQSQLLVQTSLAMLTGGKTNLVNLIDNAGNSFGTDIASSDVLSMADSLSGITASSVSFTLIPGSETTSNNESVYSVSSTDVTNLMQRIEAGQSTETTTQAQSVDPASFSVIIRNGSGITGAAASMQASLEALNFTIKETGNTDTSAYNETLVIYTESAHKAQAQTVLDAMGLGRLVQNTGAYSYDADVLVIVGKDWKPTS